MGVAWKRNSGNKHVFTGFNGGHLLGARRLMLLHVYRSR